MKEKTYINDFNNLVNTVETEHFEHWQNQSKHIIKMFEILRDNGYSETGSIKTIYTKLNEKINTIKGAGTEVQPVYITIDYIVDVLESSKYKKEVNK